MPRSAGWGGRRPLGPHTSGEAGRRDRGPRRQPDRPVRRSLPPAERGVGRNAAAGVHGQCHCGQPEARPGQPRRARRRREQRHLRDPRVALLRRERQRGRGLPPQPGRLLEGVRGQDSQPRRRVRLRPRRARVLVPQRRRRDGGELRLPPRRGRVLVFTRPVREFGKYIQFAVANLPAECRALATGEFVSRGPSRSGSERNAGGNCGKGLEVRTPTPTRTTTSRAWWPAASSGTRPPAGIDLPYTFNTVVRDTTLVGRAGNRFPTSGVGINTATRFLTLERVAVSGFKVGIDVPGRGTRWSLSPGWTTRSTFASPARSSPAGGRSSRTTRS